MMYVLYNIVCLRCTHNVTIHDKTNHIALDINLEIQVTQGDTSMYIIIEQPISMTFQRSPTMLIHW